MEIKEILWTPTLFAEKFDCGGINPSKMIFLQ